MVKNLRTATALYSAVGIALGMQVASVQAAEPQKDASGLPQIVRDNMARAAAKKLEKCYGINSVGKNDCAEGAHSCAGQAPIARDSKSFVLVPAGDCEKIEGGKLKAS